MKYTEQMLLDPEVRKQLIKSFKSESNQNRKREAFKAYECLKDKTIHYVLELIQKQFSAETVFEMQYAMTNISILRKVINKLAKVYTNGAKREIPGSESDTKAIEAAEQYLKIDERMAKCNRYFRTFWNTLAFPHPVQREDGKFDIRIEIKPPFHYDVVEHPFDPQEPLAVVLSDYIPERATLYSLGDPATAQRGRGANDGVGVVRNIAAPDAPDTASAADKLEYIWWTKNLHFTTNSKGEIISNPGMIENPIGALPFVNFAGDQDGQFWAERGSDLVDAGIKINTQLSNMTHIGVSQGHGQLYMTGKNLPKTIKVGPNHCVQLPQEEGEPAPTIGYLNANPQIAELRANVEMMVALMLSTNNLSTSGFSMSLSSGKDFASGIALMIDKSESVEDVQDQAQIFVDREPKVWEVVGKWFEVYGSAKLLSEEASLVKLPKDLSKVQVRFPSPKPIITETEHLAVIEKRKELGLNTMVELIMRDDPSIRTETEAQEKLKKIEEEKKARMEAFAPPQGEMNGDQSGSDRIDGQLGENNLEDRLPGRD